MEQEEVLRVAGLTKKFPAKKGASFFTVVQNVSFKLHKGEVLGILGPNGAGKTTLMHMLLSLLKPSSGTITYFGKDFFSHRSTLLQDISFASSYAQLPAQLSVRTNLDIYGQLYGISREERAQRIENYLKRFDIWNLVDKETGVLSAGQLTRVILTKAFLTHPRIVLLDEPTASLDPESAQSVRTFIQEQQKEQGLSLIITSHNMEEVRQICSRVLVLRQGEIIANDTPEALASSVSHTGVTLTTSMPQELTQWLSDRSVPFTRNGDEIAVKINEQDLAQFLIQLTQAGISYSDLAINKPTLHDYFMAIARDHS